LGGVALLAFILIHPPPGSPYCEFMIALVTGFGATAGLLIAVNHRALAERLRVKTNADRRRFSRQMHIGWTETSLVFIRIWAAFMTLLALIGFVGIAIGYAKDTLDIVLVTVGAVGGSLIAMDASRGG
jgi:hypothetical protein